ncbi:transposase [Mesorhizobium sp. M1328]
MRQGNGLSRHAYIAKAFAYGTKRWRAFNRFLYDGQLEPDNLIAERAIRGFTVGRRNWLFLGNFAAAERSAVVLSIKLCGVDAEAYMADVTERIQNDWPASGWDELMPWSWVRREDMPFPLAA